MKKSLLFAVLLFGGIASAQVINFTDVNLKSKLLETMVVPASCWDQNGQALQIDSNNNGEIEIAEAEAVYGLNISGANIADLTGLEAFVNVEWIQFGNNQITSFDASFFPNLKNLMCSNNPLVTLDVTGFTHLESLECEYSNLTSLNVSGLNALKNIRCSGNSLTTLDLSGLSALEEFISIEGTPFTSLNFQDNINLKTLAVNGSSLTNLDLSNNPLITYISCTDNLLLETINLHNGGLMLDPFECSFENNPNLNFICVDEGEQDLVTDSNWGELGPPPMSSTCSLGTSDTLIVNSSVRMYPNPANDKVKVDSEFVISKIELYDLSGRLIQTAFANDFSAELELTNRAAGMYLLKINTEDGIKVEKLMKK